LKENKLFNNSLSRKTKQKKVNQLFLKEGSPLRQKVNCPSGSSGVNFWQIIFIFRFSETIGQRRQNNNGGMSVGGQHGLIKTDQLVKTLKVSQN
jgi:hypothetical protein